MQAARLASRPWTSVARALAHFSRTNATSDITEQTRPMIEWPLTKGEGDDRKPVTTPTNQAIWLAALEEARQEQPSAVDELRAKFYTCRNWRKDYVQLVYEFVKLQTQVSQSTLLTMCKAGLEAARTSFVLREDAQKGEGDAPATISDVFSSLSSTKHPVLETTTVRGTQDVAGPYQYQLASPHGTDAAPVWIRGPTAVRQLDAWVNYGCMEQSAMYRAQNTVSCDDASTLINDKVFCLLGVTSELGPARTLLKIPGAHVLGVARGGKKLEALQEYVQAECPASAKLQFPQNGANILTQAPEIVRWILHTTPKDKILVIFPLVYMDGEANVRATVAMDAIVQAVLEECGKGVQLAYYTSPATALPIPKSAVVAQQYAYESQGLSWSQMLHIASFGTVLRPQFDLWTQLHDRNQMPVYNGIAHFQGPNYCLAKTMQQWRCLVADAEGTTVAAPLAPPSRTDSVQHNPQAKAALEGMTFLEPLVSFDATVCRQLMCAVVLDQLRNEEEDVHLFQLLWDGAVHGGNWRCPYVLDDGAMGVSYLLGRVSSSRRWPAATVAPL